MRRSLYIIILLLLSGCSSFRYGTTFNPIDDRRSDYEFDKVQIDEHGEPIKKEEKKTDSFTVWNTLLPLGGFVLVVKMICPTCNPFGIR